MVRNDLYIPDCIFPSDNEAEIPSLRMDVQPKVCDIPFVCFGEQKRTFQMNGTGTWDRYGSKAGKLIAKQISTDLRARGADVESRKEYLWGLGDSLPVKISQSRKDGKWYAKITNKAIV